MGNYNSSQSSSPSRGGGFPLLASHRVLVCFFFLFCSSASPQYGPIWGAESFFFIESWFISVLTGLMNTHEDMLLASYVNPHLLTRVSGVYLPH
mmetsp:Transcript_52053/g.85577  ORF Transcript_52053/g.85577 Transcript_52053/m.85577 type:complete len:94 (-) Transcript_52053:194-475(-)